MGFDYKWTCPNIDKAITRAKDKIHSSIERIVSECCPILDGNKFENFVKDWSEYIYSEIEECFETVRSSNEKIRAEAETQIYELEQKVERIN